MHQVNSELITMTWTLFSVISFFVLIVVLMLTISMCLCCKRDKYKVNTKNLGKGIEANFTGGEHTGTSNDERFKQSKQSKRSNSRRSKRSKKGSVKSLKAEKPVKSKKEKSVKLAPVTQGNYFELTPGLFPQNENDVQQQKVEPKQKPKQVQSPEETAVFAIFTESQLKKANAGEKLAFHPVQKAPETSQRPEVWQPHPPSVRPDDKRVSPAYTTLLFVNDGALQPSCYVKP